jgi:hypothetical protein
MYFYSGGTWNRANISIPTLQQVFSAEGNEAVITSSVDISPSTTGISFLMGNNGLWHDIIMQSSNQFNLSSNAVSLSAGNNNLLNIGLDSIKIGAYLGRLVIDTLNYTLSTTGKKILIRDTATGLVQNIDPSLLGASSYTFTNGLTESGGTVKLGGDLVNSTSINGKGSYSVTLDSLTGFTVKSPGLTKILTTSTQAYIYGNSSSTYMGVGTELFLAQQKSGNSISMSSDSFVLKMGGNSQLIIRPDSLNINPPLGIAIIDTLSAASNMTNKRVMTWDTVTKRWEQIAKDSVGGGTPTLQQVLTAGSNLTSSHTININNNDFIIEDGNTIQQSIIGGVNSYILLDGNFSRLYLYRDSILINPSVGNFLIDTLNYTLSTTGKKILIRDTATGLVQNIDPSLLGGGSTSPAGSDTYVQFNDGGSFGGDAGFNYNKTDNELKINTSTDNGAYKLQGEGGMYWKLDGTNAFKIVHSVGADRVTINGSTGNLDAYTFSSQNFSTSSAGSSTFNGSYMRQSGGAYFQGWQQAFSMIRTYPGTGSSPQSTVIFDNTTETSPASDYQIATFKLSGTSVAFVDKDGKYNAQSTVTAGGTTGNQTINKPTGTVNIAAAGSTVTVTNSTCTANSIVYAVLRTNDATATGIKSVVPSAGSFVITLNAAATAEVSVGFIVFN